MKDREQEIMKEKQQMMKGNMKTEDTERMTQNSGEGDQEERHHHNGDHYIAEHGSKR